MRVHPVTERDIKLFSLPLIGSLNPNFCDIDHERFKVKFEVTVEICITTWNLIAEKLNMESDIDLTGYSLKPIHILYTLFFLKCYPMACQTISILGRDQGLKTFQKYMHFASFILQILFLD